MIADKLTVYDEWTCASYDIDLTMKFGGYKPGDIICHVSPFMNVPVLLEFAIRNNGELIFRSWEWRGDGNNYIHTSEKDVKPTQEQIDTVNGIFSKRIKVFGLELSVGATLQRICPINLEQEYKRTGKKIFLA